MLSFFSHVEFSEEWITGKQEYAPVRSGSSTARPFVIGVGCGMTFEEAIIAVWHQSLVENAKIVNLNGDEFPVRSTVKQKLKQVDFRFDGRDFRALEQNPNTKSRWAAMARKGQKVMQFLTFSCHRRPPRFRIGIL